MIPSSVAATAEAKGALERAAVPGRRGNARQTIKSLLAYLGLDPLQHARSRHKRVREAKMTDAAIREDKALELRASGRSFAAIAKTLGYERTHQANEAFNRALRRKPPAERDGLCRQELTRLDAMAEGVRASHKLGPDQIAQRLETVERLRTMLLAE